MGVILSILLIEMVDDESDPSSWIEIYFSGGGGCLVIEIFTNDVFVILLWCLDFLE